MVDPRVAAVGGTRRNGKAGYHYPGMARLGDWETTAAHKSTSYYGCFLCGQGFKTPHAVYTHIAKRH